jgi:hypothetical protein
MGIENHLKNLFMLRYLKHDRLFVSSLPVNGKFHVTLTCVFAFTI